MRRWRRSQRGMATVRRAASWRGSWCRRSGSLNHYNQSVGLPAMDVEHREHLQELLHENERRLHVLEQQAARYGIDTRPLELILFSLVAAALNQLHHDVARQCQLRRAKRR